MNECIKFATIMLKSLAEYNKYRQVPPVMERSLPNQFPMRHEENQYLNLIDDILSEGTKEEGRNGTTFVAIGAAMHFSLNNRCIPFLTTKRLAWKTCLKELLWFIRGQTDNRLLQAQNVHIWDGNASREFLDSRGLVHRAEGDLGPIYGFQWRNFGGDYEDSDNDHSKKGVDQLQLIIDALKDPEQRTSRRLIISAWNPCQLHEMALPPCHVLMQFHVTDGTRLSCSLYQRSGDVGLGVPFNIASYSMLTHLLAHHCGLDAHEFVYYLGNAHIYDDHAEALKEQLKREPHDFPQIAIRALHEDISDYVLDDFEVQGYQCHDAIPMTMRE
jgi:thymidylate synthase